MKRARVIFDGQEYDAIVREFEVGCSPCSDAEITFKGVLTRRVPQNLEPKVTKVVFNNPATVVFWSDGTKTVVKCSENDTFDPEIGLAMAICKKAFGNTGAYNEVFKKWVSETSEQGRAVSVDEMRRQLVEYCRPRWCHNCKLGFAVCRCGRGAYFSCSKGDDGYMTDEEVVDAYNRVFGNER